MADFESSTRDSQIERVALYFSRVISVRWCELYRQGNGLNRILEPQGGFLVMSTVCLRYVFSLVQTKES
jgi:hypothetical protein